jgi:hypothetical protein
MTSMTTIGVPLALHRGQDEVSFVELAARRLNLNLDGDVVDAGTIAERYFAACANAGLDRPAVIRWAAPATTSEPDQQEV